MPKCSGEREIHFHILVDNGRVRDVLYIGGDGYKLKNLETIEFFVVYRSAKPQRTKTKAVKQTGLALSDIVKGILKEILGIHQQTAQKVTIHWKCLLEMDKLKITKEDLRDVFYHGSYRNSAKGTPEAIKRYSEYEIGLTYRMDKHTGDYLITWCWKTTLRTV